MPDPGSMFSFAIPADNTPARSPEMRAQFEALARLNYTTDAAYPKNPRAGMPRVLADDTSNIKLQVYYLSTPTDPSTGAWRTILQNLQLALPAPAKFISAKSGASWTIDHNLGTYPQVQVLNSDGWQMQVVPQGATPGVGEYKLQHVTVNRFVVTHNSAIDGFVIFIG